MHIGVSKETALEDACRMEHIISEETFERMKAHHNKWHEIYPEAKDVE